MKTKMNYFETALWETFALKLTRGPEAGKCLVDQSIRNTFGRAKLLRQATISWTQGFARFAFKDDPGHDPGAAPERIRPFRGIAVTIKRHHKQDSFKN